MKVTIEFEMSALTADQHAGLRALLDHLPPRAFDLEGPIDLGKFRPGAVRCDLTASELAAKLREETIAEAVRQDGPIARADVRLNVGDLVMLRSHHAPGPHMVQDVTGTNFDGDVYTHMVNGETYRSNGRFFRHDREISALDIISINGRPIVDQEGE